MSAATPDPPPHLTPARVEEVLLRADHAQVVASLSRGLAHDLRGPLQTLTLLVDPHADLLGPTESLRLRTAMSDSVQHLADTISHFTQVYTTAEAEPAPVVVDELLGLVADLQRYQRGLPRAEIELRLPGGLPAVRGIEGELRHVLLSLITNAKEALREAPAPRIIVAAAAEAGAVRLVVEDNGHGVPPGVVERAFEPFFTTRPGNLGIGLGVARGLATRTGGALTLEPREGGARAVLLLPSWRRA